MPTTAGGDHTDLTLGFSESLMGQETFGTFFGQDSEWSSMLDRIDWDLGIEGFFHIRTVQRLGTMQWHIWDPDTFCSDSGEQ